MTQDATTRRSDQHRVEGDELRRSIDGERLIAVFRQLVEPIGRSLPSTSEVVLHDLSLLPNSIIAIHGDVTGRRVGDPATDLLLGKVSSGSSDAMVGYVTNLPDGRQLRSSTMVIRDVSGMAVAALCINSDLSAWMSARHVIDALLGEYAHDADFGPAPEASPTEVFAHNVDELAAHLIHTAISDVGIPVDLMRKQHKIGIVRDLKARGMFLLRDAVDTVAEELGVTRFTIYNYLNEIAEDDQRSAGDETRGQEGDAR